MKSFLAWCKGIFVLHLLRILGRISNLKSVYFSFNNAQHVCRPAIFGKIKIVSRERFSKTDSQKKTLTLALRTSMAINLWIATRPSLYQTAHK